MSRFDCLKPEEEDLESLDGDAVMRSSTISLGITLTTMAVMINSKAVLVFWVDDSNFQT